MIRIENATRISIEARVRVLRFVLMQASTQLPLLLFPPQGCRLLHAGLSAVWVAGWSQNVTVDGCWIEGPGFCGVATAGA